MAQQVKDLVLSPLWLGFFCMLQVQPKKKKKDLFDSPLYSQLVNFHFWSFVLRKNVGSVHCSIDFCYIDFVNWFG